jgi:hypothetical protein
MVWVRILLELHREKRVGGGEVDRRFAKRAYVNIPAILPSAINNQQAAPPPTVHSAA